MSLKFVLFVSAAMAASPVLAQSVTISESAPKTQALSPSLGSTDTLAIITPAQADAMIEVPVVNAPPASGEVMPSLGETETLAIVSPDTADVITSTGTLGLLPADEQNALDSLPRITPAQAATIVGTAQPSGLDAAPLEEEVTIYVVEEGTVLPASSWNQEQSDACKASGGVEIPLPAGRIACFKL